MAEAELPSPNGGAAMTPGADEPTRRDFLYIATAAVGSVGALRDPCPADRPR